MRTTSQIFSDYSGTNNAIINAHNAFGGECYANGMYKEACDISKKKQRVEAKKEFSGNVMNKTKEFEAKYDAEKKEREIERLMLLAEINKARLYIY